ncbi:hypothetical protein ZIOFF_019244 [Zingiber officinale]|uniref:C2 domain-containing protein n=1 Tax=Zingiber officinale TaxID=94328 RepID=A0A8J5H6W2_ZINOF|nr:hypothetical protein ZIOFF_019244 [Zingiber officinale]
MKAEDLAMEVRVISAEDLETPWSVFGRRLRPFVALFAAADTLDCDCLPPLLHRTRVVEDGDSPAWGDLIRVPLEPSFLLSLRAGGGDDEAGVYLVVLSERPLVGAARLGWCRVPLADVLDGVRHPSALRRLSYALRHPRHGGRGRGVIHLAVRLVGRDLDRLLQPHLAQPSLPLPSSHPQWGGVAIGIPVEAFGHPPSWASSGGGGVENVGFVEGRVGFGVGFDFRLNYQPI